MSKPGGRLMRLGKGTRSTLWRDRLHMARSVVYSVLENGARDGTGFHTILGPGCGFECGIEDVSYSNSLLGAEYVLE
jgi:hypothetical protein